MTLVEETFEQNTLVLSELTGNACDTWDTYVRSAQGGLPLHLSGWRHVLRDTYGYETRYLLAKSGPTVVGVLPLFLIPSRLIGKRAMTMPGGVCAENDLVAISLIEHGLQVVNNKGIERLLVQDARQTTPGNWQSESRHVYWLVDLRSSEEASWKELDGNIRRQVRKAKRNGLEIEIDRSGKLIDPFYEMFSEFTHQAGTPVYDRGFLENVVNIFPDGFNIAIVRYEQRPIAGYFQLEMGDTVYGMWGAALGATLKLRPAYLALWEIMRDAINRGFAHLDMGRSPADGNASKFKGQWGGKSHPVYQTIINGNGYEHSKSMTNQVQSGERFQLFMQIWPKLPLSVTRYLGPKLRWHIPFA